MEKSMIIYSITFALSILFASLYQKQQVKRIKYLDSLSQNSGSRVVKERFGIRKIVWFSVILFAPVFIATVRWNIGTDFINYLIMFRQWQTSDVLQSIIESREPLYAGLNHLADFLFSADWGIFFLSSLITMLFVLLTADYYKKHLSVAMLLLIYFLVFYILTFNIVRQMIAVSIILYAYRFVLERKFLKYSIMTVIAAMFHQSAIICIVFYFLRFRTKGTSIIKTVLYYIFILFSPLLILPIITFIASTSLLSDYFDSYSIVFQGIGLGFLIDVLPVVLPALLFRKHLIKLNPDYNFFVNLSLMTFTLRILGYYIFWAHRLMYYSSIIQIILVPIIIHSIKDKTKRILAYYVFFIVYLIYFIYQYVVLNVGPAFPYQSIFE